MINFPGMDVQNSVLPQLDENHLNKLKGRAKVVTNKTDEELMSVSHQFESIFIHQLLKSMRSTIQKSGLFDSHATRMYESMHDQELANLMSEKRSIGLANMVYKDLVRLEQKSKNEKLEDNEALMRSKQAAGILG